MKVETKPAPARSGSGGRAGTDREGEARPPARPGHSGGDDSVGRGTEFIPIEEM